MIKKLLIANRGEIANRIIATAQKLGIETIAVYSTADKNAGHVRQADRSFLLGDPSPQDSYLNIRKILEIATTAKVDAIHPGYGFLAENSQFASACEENGIIFIGPPVDAINQMGLKSTARTLAAKASLPLLPGIEDFDPKDKNLPAQLEKIGFPLLLKPSAGGGGKGMKVIASMHEFEGAVKSAQREALSSFGNDHLIIEKYLQNPRHIEMQIFGDSHGNYVHLNERDCSLQRRHQKIIEESPAPGFSNELRQSMGESAIKLAQAINYVGAGTVEFLLDGDSNYYFMEMNTRLQVEHPVTESITGYDLVEWQIRVAEGEPLPVKQSDISITGHAIEARIYAEDPSNDFLPASGKISHLRLPDCSDKLRVDNGTGLNETVGVYYDPMMMKVIGRDTTRETCISTLANALGQLEIGGISTNRDFLIAMLAERAFIDGKITTNYLDSLSAAGDSAGSEGAGSEGAGSEGAENEGAESEGTGSEEKDLQDNELALSAAALFVVKQMGTVDAEHALENPESLFGLSPWDRLMGFRLNQPDNSSVFFNLAGHDYHLIVSQSSGASEFLVKIGQKNYEISLNSTASSISFSWKGKSYTYSYFFSDNHLTLFSRRRTFQVRLQEDYSHLAAEEEGGLQAPMSGKIIEILVNSGEKVCKGQALLIMEAMKMEHTIVAPANGQVISLNFALADLVEEGIPVLEFEPEVLD